MIDRLVELSLRNRFLVVAFFLHVGGWGYWALLTTPIDAIPGGVYLLWALGDNAVAVWVGFIALFGTAVQTMVVMVIYLDGSPRC